jgi:two-component system chemotaxis response regulator CheY
VPLDYGKLKVLLVNGNVAEANALAAMLDGFGITRIDSARDVAAALRLLRQGRLYDLMLCDYSLGVANGLSLVKVIRRDNRLTNRYMPVIMTLDRNGVERQAVFRAAGVNDLLSKPVSSHILFDSLRATLGHTRSFVETKTYFGPDRRQRQQDGLRGRRSQDALAGSDAEDILL